METSHIPHPELGVWSLCLRHDLQRSTPRILHLTPHLHASRVTPQTADVVPTYLHLTGPNAVGCLPRLCPGPTAGEQDRRPRTK